MKKTAIQEMRALLNVLCFESEGDKKLMQKMFNDYEQFEKSNIIDAYEHPISWANGISDGEEYYNETFNKKK